MLAIYGIYLNIPSVIILDLPIDLEQNPDMKRIYFLVIFLFPGCYSMPLHNLPRPDSKCEQRKSNTATDTKSDTEKLQPLNCPLQNRDSRPGPVLEDAFTIVLEDFESMPDITLALLPEPVDSIPDLVDRATIRGTLHKNGYRKNVPMQSGRYYGKLTIESVVLHPPFYSTWSSLTIYFGYENRKGFKLSPSSVTACMVPEKGELIGSYILCPPLDVSPGKPNILKLKLSRSETISGGATGVIYLITLGAVFHAGPFGAVVPVILGPVGTEREIHPASELHKELQ